MRKGTVAVVVLVVLMISAVLVDAAGSEPLKIVCIKTDCRGGEVVVILNATSREIDLTGYLITSEGGQSFEFRKSEINPQVPRIGPFDIVRLHSQICDVFAGPRDFFWVTKEGECYNAPVWNNSADVARLYAPCNSVDPISIFSYGDDD